jgi:hypothetical protein
MAGEEKRVTGAVRELALAKSLTLAAFLELPRGERVLSRRVAERANNIRQEDPVSLNFSILTTTPAGDVSPFIILPVSLT